MHCDIPKYFIFYFKDIGEKGEEGHWCPWVCGAGHQHVLSQSASEILSVPSHSAHLQVLWCKNFRSIERPSILSEITTLQKTKQKIISTKSYC